MFFPLLGDVGVGRGGEQTTIKALNMRRISGLRDIALERRVACFCVSVSMRCIFQVCPFISTAIPRLVSLLFFHRFSLNFNLC